jgi:hypothetical protein
LWGFSSLRCACHRDNNQFDDSNECGRGVSIELFKRGEKALRRDHHLIPYILQKTMSSRGEGIILSSK